MLKKILPNKRGDKIISVYWFAVLIIVAGGIFGMVYVFYGTPYDIRELEVNLLINKIADCVSYAGRINSNVVSEGVFNKDFNLSNDCNLILTTDEWEEVQYYTKVDFYNINNANTPIFTLANGNSNLLTNCEIQEDKEYSKLAKCADGSFYSLDSLDNQYIIKILTSVRKAEKNVKV